MTKAEFKELSHDEQCDYLEGVQTFLNALAQYLEENQPFATNSIHTLREAAFEIPSEPEQAFSTE